MGKTAIEWASDVWNPVVGCSIESAGCKNCYAMKMAHRLQAMGQEKYQGTTEKVNGKAVWTGKVNEADKNTLTAPLRWKKPRRIFVNSMGDLFHEDVPFKLIDKVFTVMARCRQHTFLVLTKRAGRMQEYVSDVMAHQEIIHRRAAPIDGAIDPRYVWPLSNVWLGVSVETQKYADERIPCLLETPAAVRFVSAEPLLGPVDFERGGFSLIQKVTSPAGKVWPGLDWLIVGGESGPGARPMHPDWARSIRDQCQAAGVPFFVKQMAKKAPLPADLMIREFP